MLPDGDYLVSSETEPSIRIYNREGVQQASLPVPARFAVTGTTPDGQATSNATLEGLTISRPGRRSSPRWRPRCPATSRPAATPPCTGSWSTTQAANGNWQLTKQIAYRTDPGMRVPEVAGLRRELVAGRGGVVQRDDRQRREAVRGDRPEPGERRQRRDQPVPGARPRRGGQEAGRQPGRLPVAGRDRPRRRRPTRCWTTSRAWPSSAGPGLAGVSLISDDNFSATQSTRVLNLAVKLP